MSSEMANVFHERAHPCNNTHYVPYDCVFQQSVKYLCFSVLATLDPSTDLIICSLKNKHYAEIMGTLLMGHGICTVANLLFCVHH